MSEMGRKLLESVGTPTEAITDQMIDAAIIENDIFVAKLEAIRDDAKATCNSEAA
jgi:hypothetical protein